jgi:ABC-type transporter Mla MlaB component
MTGDSVHTLEISGHAGLRNVQDVASLLRQAMDNHSNITVATDGLNSIDVTILQLLVAARKSALESGKTLTLHAAPGGVLQSLLLQAGFVGSDGQSRTPEGEFWTKTSATEQAA